MAVRLQRGVGPGRYPRKRGKGNVKAQTAARRARRRLFLFDYLLAHPCVDCGEADPVVLEFDHVRGVKLFDISRCGSFSAPAVVDEIAKCDVRCANCHRRKTVREKDHLRRYDRATGKIVLAQDPQTVLFSSR